MRGAMRNVIAGAAGAALVLTGLLACPTDQDCPTAEPYVPTMEAISRSTGEAVFCWVDGDGALACWPDELQQMDGFPTGTFVWVSVGEDHLCAVRDDLSGTCWGWGPCEHGECDDPDGEFVYIRAGIDLNCGETTAGEVVCWGLEAEL